MIEKLVRENIKNLSPYSSARKEYSGKANVWLDANENPYESDYNRYPDPLQNNLKEKLSELKKVSKENIFVGNGSDEALDLMLRIFCEPKEDAIVYSSPTYSMYKVIADINNINAIDIPLSENFSMDVKALSETKAKILFICSPNNPTGNQFKKEDILYLIVNFKGVVVVDEAYADFAEYSILDEINNFENLIVCQTFSKSWGLAGLRIGLAFANSKIIDLMNRVKMPYNVNTHSQKIALDYLNNEKATVKKIIKIKSERQRLVSELKDINEIDEIYPSEGNFLLIRFKSKSKEIYKSLLKKGILIRDLSNKTHCKNTLRITIGTPTENDLIISELKQF